MAKSLDNSMTAIVELISSRCFAFSLARVGLGHTTQRGDVLASAPVARQNLSLPTVHTPYGEGRGQEVMSPWCGEGRGLSRGGVDNFIKKGLFVHSHPPSYPHPKNASSML